MNAEGERDLFIRYGTFKGLYKFKRSDGIYFYVNREEQERLTSPKIKEGKRSLLVCYGTFKGLYKFKRRDGTYFYVTKDGMQIRLRKLINLGEPHDQTEEALKLPS